MMNNDPFTLDDALAAISAYALALRDDSDATDSTLDDLQYDLDCMLDHDAASPIDDTYDDRRNPHPDIDADTLDSLRTAANAIFYLRP